MDDNFFDDDLFDDAPFQFFEFADSFFGAPSATSFTLTRHGPFHTTRSNLLPRLPLPTLTPRLSTTATVSSLVATAPVAARQQVPANFSSTTSQQQTNLPSLSFSTARRDLLPVPRVANPPSTARPSALNREPNSDDYYLNQLATQDFSSPSLPLRSPCPSGRNRDSGNHTNSSSLWNTGVAALSGADILRRADQLVTGPSFGNRQTEPRADPQDPSCPRPQSPNPNMPPATRRKRRSGGASDGDSDLIEVSPPAGPSRRSPRTRTTRSTPQQTRPVEILDSDDVFGSPSPSATRVRQSTVVPKEEKDLADKKRKRDLFETEHDPDGSDGEDIPVVNLADTETVPESVLKQQKPKNEVKLSTFQCVICMDDCTDLTVTHCGHLFCSECLHSSLHIDVTKKVCPICRQSIETKPASGRFTAKQKGYYHLELKLLTKKTLEANASNDSDADGVDINKVIEVIELD